MADSDCHSWVRDIKKYAEEKNQPKEGDDLLAQKAEFMRIYTFRASQWRCYYTLGYKKGRYRTVPLWTKKWHDYEQVERLKAQKRWREILSHTR